MDLEQQLNKILSDPESMSQIMQLAQSLGSSSGSDKPNDSASENHASPGQAEQLFNMMRKMQELGQADPKQQALVEALKPFVTPEHCKRLDRAIQLSKLSHMAGLALQEFDFK